MSQELPKARNTAVRYMSEHPLLTAIFITCTVIGAILGAVYLTQDWSLARRIAAGGVAGAGVALLTTAPRIVG